MTTHWLKIKVQCLFWYFIFLVTVINFLASLINVKPEYEAAFIGQIRPILRYSIIRSDSALCYKLQNQLVGCYIQLAQIHCTLCYLKGPHSTRHRCNMLFALWIMHYAVCYLPQRQLYGGYIQLVTNVLCYLHYATCFTANLLGLTFNLSPSWG